jgi:hypothetical protein
MLRELNPKRISSEIRAGLLFLAAERGFTFKSKPLGKC